MLRLLQKLKPISPEDKKLYVALVNLLGFSPKNLNLYKQAFRHKSAAQQVKQGVKDDNERLEYLGDAVLGAIVAEYLFKKFPYKNEGFLTKMRSRMVSRENNSLLSKKMGLEKLISKGSDVKGGQKSIAGDAFEALIGAVYLDMGYLTTKKFVVERIIQMHIDLDQMETIDTDYKSQMIEWAQRNKVKIEFRIISESGNGFEKNYCIHLLVNDNLLSEAYGQSKKRAEQLAAEKVIKEGLPEIT